MAHTYTNLLVHGIFSTKDRLPLIEPEIKDELLAVVGGIIRNLKGRAYAVNGTADHLHMLVSLQEGYGAFSVSKSNVPDVIKYIDTQEEHHRKVEFKEEFIGFLRKHGIEYDERYIWG